MNDKVRTRFAPSPTGPLHMGGVRTALFNYLFARKNGGDFLLRIEDTDQTRYVPGAEQYIIEALQWCDIQIDEGVSKGGKFEPYRQSERKESGVYMEHALQLIESGHAYYAFDSPEDLEEMRNRFSAKGIVAPQYNHESRNEMKNSLTLTKTEVEKRIANQEPYVIRLKVEKGKTISFNDLIRGEVAFQSDLVDDKVLLKSDGMPTYHLAHIVDDVLMEISHTIRGEEWLPSAPSHQLIYNYLNWNDRQPQYAHLPLLLKPDGNGKLSKRDGDRLGFPVFPLQWEDPSTGDISTGYREQGYYPDAFVNMLAFLGWNPGTEQEIFSMDELIAAFSFEHVHKSGAKFDPDKARWYNEQYLRKQPSSKLISNLRTNVLEAFPIKKSDRVLDEKYLLHAVELLKERVQFEKEMVEIGSYLFQKPLLLDENIISKKWKAELLPFFNALKAAFNKLESLNTENTDQIIKKVAEEHQIKPGSIMQLLRVFISGQGSGVDLLGMIQLLGKEEVCERIENSLKLIPVNNNDN